MVARLLMSHWLHAGEYSGRLDSCFRLLSDHYQDRARLARQMIGRPCLSGFPVFNFAIFIFAFVHIFASSDWMGFVWRTFGVLIPLYVIFLALAYAAQGRHGERLALVGRTLSSTSPSTRNGATLSGVVTAGGSTGGAV